MCARYELNEQPSDLAARFGLDVLPPALNRDIVRPTDQALVIGGQGDARLCSWGLEVSWDKKPLINGRSETLAEKPTFRPLLENRCVVPATAYFEWRPDNGAKLKNRIRPSDQIVFSMAGLKDGERFVILTCAPSPEISHIHNRMPVILTQESEIAWLDKSAPFSAVASCLVPYDQARVDAREETPPPPRQGDLFS